VTVPAVVLSKSRVNQGGLPLGAAPLWLVLRLIIRLSALAAPSDIAPTIDAAIINRIIRLNFTILCSSLFLHRVI
jgi:hypothetical protein